jgi:hypothetical protein
VLGYNPDIAEMLVFWGTLVIRILALSNKGTRRLYNVSILFYFRMILPEIIRNRAKDIEAYVICLESNI